MSWGWTRRPSRTRCAPATRARSSPASTWKRSSSCPSSCRPSRTSRCASYVKSLAPALPDPRCDEVFAQGLTPNPRQVKRTLNIYLLLTRLVEKREALRDTIRPVRLAKMVAIQHAHPDLYNLLRLRPGYLRDLEGFFRGAGDGAGGRAPETELPRLAEALEPFQGREALRRLLLLCGEEDARFEPLTPLELRSYITLARRATPVEAPAVQAARQRFEPEMVPVPAGPFLMGTGDEQVQAMLDRYEWAKEFQDKGWFERGAAPARGHAARL